MQSQGGGTGGGGGPEGAGPGLEEEDTGGLHEEGWGASAHCSRIIHSHKCVPQGLEPCLVQNRCSASIC